MDINWTIVGIIAGAITVFGFVPQIYQGYRTKHLNDLSYFMMFFLALGMSIWLVYGIHLGDVPIILANFFGIACNVSLILMKFYYSKNSKNSKNKKTEK